MMQVVPKWKVSIFMPDDRNYSFWMYEYQISNVLRNVASMQFTESGLPTPIKIEVSIGDK